MPGLLWDILNPTSYYIFFRQWVIMRGEIVYKNVALPTAEPQHSTIPNIRHWTRRTMRKFRTHFIRWMKKIPSD